MKNRIFPLVSLAVLLATTSVQASEFDGLYIGGRAGYNRSDITGPLKAAGKDTTTWGLDEGYNWDMQSYLLGANFSVDVNHKADHVNPTRNYSSSAIGLGLKLGLPMGSWMPYAHLGYAKTKGGYDASTINDGGIRAGVGIEYKYTPNWGVNAEWAGSSAKHNDSKLTNDNITFGLKYYFNVPKAVPTPAPEPAPAPVAIQPPPKAEPVPAPAPAVVAAPEPVPAPVVIPVPAPQPKESWKTILTQKPVRLEGANFATNSAKLLKTADKRLNEVVEAAKKYPEVMLEVSGHTDSRGKKALNQRLSVNRAMSVKAWLVQHGVAANRISTVGYAETKPIADNETEKGRAANRRVEVNYVIKEEKKVRVTE